MSPRRKRDHQLHANRQFGIPHRPEQPLVVEMASTDRRETAVRQELLPTFRVLLHAPKAKDVWLVPLLFFNSLVLAFCQ
jgi:hypothetical protein